MNALVLKRLRTIWELVFSYLFLASAGLLMPAADRPYLILSMLVLWGLLFVISYLWGCYDFETGTAHGIRWRTEGVFVVTVGGYLLLSRTLLPWLVPFPIGLGIGLFLYLNLLSPLLALPVGRLVLVPAVCVFDRSCEEERRMFTYWGYDCTHSLSLSREELAGWLKANSDQRRRPTGCEVVLLDLHDPESERLALALSRIYFVEFIGVRSTDLWSYLRGRHCKRISFMPMLELNRRIKRLVDVLLAILLLVVLSPLLLFTVIVIKLDSPGPVLYKHWRLGKEMRHFSLYKFRTMFRDADERLQKILASDPKLKEEFETTYKLKNDPRVTNVGRFLRLSSVDELPQLLNVIKDQMSLVGPRPIVDGEIRFYEASNLLPFRVTPGMTSLWGISGRTETSYERRVELDVQYVTHWSYGQDIKILLRTIPAVLAGRGAY
jgi:lipopolysaccharide/colanic/teichoic acid biosynthesis glycosyltransferase